MIRWKRKLVACKSESPYGTDSVPTAAANAILTRNVQLAFLDLDYEERNVDIGNAGHQGEIIVGSRFRMSFEVEIAGASALGVAHGAGPIFKGAGCSETLNPGVSSVYAPVAPGAAVSFSTYFWNDGKLYMGLGCFAEVGLRWQRGRIPVFAVSVLGLHVQPVDQAVPAPTLSGFKKPVGVNAVNTTPMTLHTFAGKFTSCSVDFGNVLAHRNMPNGDAVRFVDRKSVGQVVLEDELIATKDWPSIIKAQTTGALAITHGPAGNRVTFNAPNTQITRPGKSITDDIVDDSFALNFQPSSAGNDEWSITFL